MVPPLVPSAILATLTSLNITLASKTATRSVELAGPAMIIPNATLASPGIIFSRQLAQKHVPKDSMGWILTIHATNAMLLVRPVMVKPKTVQFALKDTSERMRDIFHHQGRNLA